MRIPDKEYSRQGHSKCRAGERGCGEVGTSEEEAGALGWSGAGGDGLGVRISLDPGRVEPLRVCSRQSHEPVYVSGAPRVPEQLIGYCWESRVKVRSPLRRLPW